MTTVVSHADAMDQTPDPEVLERAKRPRSYSARYKAEILAEYEQLDKAGKGALLRREGLYTSLLSEWRNNATGARWRRCSSGVAAHRSTRWPGRMLGWSGRTPACAIRSPARPR